MAKILIYADMLCNTGFAHVSHNIIKQLKKDGHTFVGLGINYRGEPKEIYYPDMMDVPVFPTNNRDPLGKERILECINSLDYDILFVIGDVFNLVGIEPHLKQLKERGKKTVLYFPVDASIKKEWVNTIKAFDVAITYTQFAHNECVKYGLDIPYIYHGYDDKIYYNRKNKEQLRAKHFSFLKSTDRLFINVNVNQPRKDLPTTIDAFAEYFKTNKDSYLYMHCIVNDPRGINLEKYIIHYYPHLINNIVFPDTQDIISQQYTDEMMAELYNCADLLVSSTLGEGWGLSFTEALACGTRIIGPDNTSVAEIINEFGGIKICSRGMRVNTNDNSWARPITDNIDMAEKMGEDYDELNYINGNKLSEITWDKIGLKWREIIKNL